MASALLDAQADAQPTSTVSDIENLEALGVIQIPSTTTANPYLSQPPLQGVVDNSAVLQRLTELEEKIKEGFDSVSSKLANTMITVASAPPSTQRGGRTRRSKKTRRSRMRSKRN